MKYASKSCRKEVAMVKDVLEFLTALITFLLTVYSVYNEWKKK